MNAGGSSRRLMADINVTPFVDVMLVLLVIFMVTAPMMVQGINVNLPEVTAKPLPSEQEHLMISIDAEGKVFINDFQVGVDALGEKLSSILQRRINREVYLKADRSVPYGEVVQVMAAIKAAGVDKLGMVTLPPAREQTEKPESK
jgi:biopolymer transport protein TolR